MQSEDRFKPFDNTGYRMSDTESQICAKGLKFVPSIKRINRHKKDLDFDRSPRLLRLAVYHHRRSRIRATPLDTEKYMGAATIHERAIRRIPR